MTLASGTFLHLAPAVLSDRWQSSTQPDRMFGTFVSNPPPLIETNRMDRAGCVRGSLLPESL